MPLYTARPPQTEDIPQVTRLIAAENILTVEVALPDHEIERASEEERAQLLEAGVRVESLGG